MRFSSADVPDRLVEAARSGDLVVFAGAGVSMQEPVCLPSFNRLVEEIKSEVDPGNRSRARGQRLANDGSVYTETPEQYLSYLDAQTHEVKQACGSILSCKESERNTTDLHRSITRLFPGAIPIRIVTTNFDNCFEAAFEECGETSNSYVAPALPYGDKFSGLVHLHGVADKPDSMVLLAEDYGRAYVTNGWASRFLVDLFQKYTVLFIGYSCGDTPVDYLTRSISNSMEGNTYALCRKGEDTTSWATRGVTPVFFEDFSVLPTIVKEWADYLDQGVTAISHRIREITSKQEISKPEQEYILQAFNWDNDDSVAAFVRAFCSEPTYFEHLDFLVRQGNTDFLTSLVPTRAEQELLWWAVQSFSINCCSDFQRLLIPIRDKLSPSFFWSLVDYLSTVDAPSKVLGVWITWLEDMSAQYYVRLCHPLLMLADHCHSPEIVLSIIKMLLRVNLSVSEDSFSGMKQEPAIAVRDDSFKQEVLKCLKEHKRTIGDRVFEYCFEQVEHAYSIQTQCWTKPETFDVISFDRAAVEPHEQDRDRSSAGGVLLDFLRESARDEAVDREIEECLGSRCSILVRLGLWLIKEYRCTGDVLHDLQERDYLSNLYLHHEFYHLTRAAFSVATDEQRDAFADYLESYCSTGEKAERRCFDLINWILQTASCDRLSVLLSRIHAKYPTWRSTEHPDLIWYTTSGFIDDEKRDKISRSQFTIEEMTRRLSQLETPGDSFAESKLVSVPSKEYPELAFDMLRTLLRRDRTESESHLCRLLIRGVDWRSSCITPHGASELFVDIFEQSDLSLAGIDALAYATLDSDAKVDWATPDLIKMLVAASESADVFWGVECDVRPQNDADWLTVGINFPAGKYLQLIAVAGQHVLKDDVRSSEEVKRLLEEFDPLSAKESVGSKGVIACFFEYLNVWAKLDEGYVQKAVMLLSSGSWACIPAWSGMSFISFLSTRTWKMTECHGAKLFSGTMLVGEGLVNRLTQLYLRSAISYSDEATKAKILKSCGTYSESACKAACSEIGSWLSSLDDSEKNSAWDGWLSDSFEYIAKMLPEGGGVLTHQYCRWIYKHPSLRPAIAKALRRDCTDVGKTNMFLPEGTFEEIAKDENLSASDSATIIAFILDHQQYLLRLR